LPAIVEIARNSSSEQSDALIWRLPAEQGIEWGKINRRAPRHYLECKSVKRLSGLSNNRAPSLSSGDGRISSGWRRCANFGANHDQQPDK
jgi:hypothetical protein